MTVYDAESDPSCYENSDVLINIPGLRVQSELEKFENIAVAQRSRERLPFGKLSGVDYFALHKHLFKDVYRWAGQIRTIRIGKQGNWFCYPEHIQAEIKAIFDWLETENNLRDLDADDFSEKAAHFIAELNAIHPFREGNGRTQNIFLGILADQGGHPLDFELLDSGKFLQAMIESFVGSEEPLAQIIRQVMRAA